VPSKRQRAGTCKLASLHVSLSQANFFPQRIPQLGEGGSHGVECFILGASPPPRRGRRARLTLGCNIQKQSLMISDCSSRLRFNAKLWSVAQGAKLLDRATPKTVAHSERQNRFPRSDPNAALRATEALHCLRPRSHGIAAAFVSGIYVGAASPLPATSKSFRFFDVPGKVRL
jgi:hypothetical protein